MLIVLLVVFAVGAVFGAVLTAARQGALSSPWGEPQRPGELERRLARIEQAAEETTRAVDRLEEGQRFLLNALTARGDADPRAVRRSLAPGEHPAIAPHDHDLAAEAPREPPGERRG